MSDSEKKKFLRDELFSMTLMATVQRGQPPKTTSDKALRQRLARMGITVIFREVGS